MSEASPTWSIADLGRFVEVEQRKRRVMIVSLTLVGVFFLITYAIVSINVNLVGLGVFLLGCAVVGMFNLLYLRLTGRDAHALGVLNVILGSLCMVLLITGGNANTGPYWIYPALAVGIFINRFRIAVYFGVGFILLSAFVLFAFDSMVLATYTPSESIRFIITLTALAAVSLTGLYQHETAKDVMMQLHNEDIQKLAFYDGLTGLANRSSFLRRLQKMLDRARRDHRGLALLYIDLDKFKQVNDRYGHQVGDRLLAEFGEQLAHCVRPMDEPTRIIADEDVARLAGDEFVVTLTDTDDPALAESVAQRILDLFANGFEVDGRNLPVTASIGIAMIDHQVDSAETLLNQADAAMYEAKSNGRNGLQFFSQDIERALLERHNIESGLQVALAENQFSLVYMPIYDSSSLSVTAVEVLLRCHTDVLQGIGPDRFIPVAESTGLIRHIDQWVLAHAFAGLKRLREEHGFDGVMCINISSLELHNVKFADEVAALINELSLATEGVELEVTETNLAVDDERSVATLRRLKSMGFGLSLDDFGTGYTAFSQLMNYPVDRLKIDRSFVDGLFSEQPARRQMVNMILSLAELYDLNVTAEGVETDEQLTYLQQIGCGWLQGNLLSEPLTEAEFVKLLQRRPARQSAP